MKKLMIAAVAMAASVAMADVTSANIVGFSSYDKTGAQYVSLGVGFTQVTDGESIVLGSIKPTAWDSSADVLQVISAETANPTAAYVYYGAWEGAEGTEIGWWDSEFGDMYDSVEFPVGTAFLGNFAAKDAEFKVSGAVIQGATALDYTGKQYVMLSNILPMQITLGDIVPTAWDSSADVLQVLSTETANPTAAYVYYGEWEGAEGTEIGWWDSEFGDMYNTVPVASGDGFLGNFAAKDVQLAFPAAL